MLEILIIILLGVIAGVFTGLTPGIHPNTVIFTSMPLYFGFGLDFWIYASFISGISVSHTFHDFIPSIFLGVPDPASALSALPGQKMALQGRGLEAFNYTVYGGIYAMLSAVVFSAILYFALPKLYSFLEPYMAYILLFIALLIVFKSDSELNAAVVAALSGALGFLSFAAPVNQQYVLTPIFGGLFAFPSLLQALNAGDKIPEQFPPDIDRGYRSGGFLGFLASVPIIVFPGLSSSVATTFLMPLLNSRNHFLSAVGGVNTSDIFLSFLTLMAMERARSGASVAIQTTGNSDALIFVIGASIFAIALSVPVAFFSARLFLKSGLIRNQEAVSVFISLLLLFTTFYLTGFLGVLIFFTASAIGCFAAVNSERHSCMAVLLLPSITFFTSGIFM
jgi:putative membrane protein